jgi:hypothetical protein
VAAPAAPREAPPRPAPPAVADASPDAPAPAPDAPARAGDGTAEGSGAGRSLAAGTVLAGTLEQRVCTESNRPGDRLVATLSGAVNGPGGVVLPAGTPLVLEVSRVAGDPPVAEFVVRGVSVEGEFVPVVADASPVRGETERREVTDKAGDLRERRSQGRHRRRHPRPRARRTGGEGNDHRGGWWRSGRRRHGARQVARGDVRGGRGGRAGAAHRAAHGALTAG